MAIFLNIIITLLCIPWPGVIMMSPMMIAAPGFATKKSNVTGAILFFLYPLFLFLFLMLIGYSFYDTNPAYWALAVLCIGSIIVLLYQLPQQLMNLYRGIPNYDYFISGNAVYLNGSRIKGADPKSFIQYPNSYYSKDAHHVYRETKKISRSDVATFGPLLNDDTNNYWHDKNHAYYTWQLIPDADGASFEYLGHNYVRDKNNIYWGNKKVEGADRATFRSLDSFIGKDNTHVYILTKQVSNAIDLDSFEVVSLNNELFCKDKNQFFIIRYRPEPALEVFPNADVATFEILDNSYSRDKNQVYYYSRSNNITILKAANPSTFRTDYNSEYRTDATDGINLYKEGELFVPVKQ